MSRDVFESGATYMNSVERRALDMCVDHAREINKIVKFLMGVLQKWIDGDSFDSSNIMNEFIEMENKADSIKKGILDFLSQAQTLLNREDIVRLVLKVDDISDFVESVAYQLSVLSLIVPPTITYKDLKTMLDNTLESMELLERSISFLGSNPEKSLELVDRIDELEKKIDIAHRRVVSTFFDTLSDIRTLIRLREILSHVEGISDLVEEAADAVRILAMSR
ncbi:MAG: DUF47 domain-containing protein [Candidatus Asgardarchaeia archaeon]